MYLARYGLDPAGRRPGRPRLDRRRDRIVLPAGGLAGRAAGRGGAARRAGGGDGGASRSSGCGSGPRAGACRPRCPASTPGPATPTAAMPVRPAVTSAAATARRTEPRPAEHRPGPMRRSRGRIELRVSRSSSDEGGGPCRIAPLIVPETHDHDRPDRPRPRRPPRRRGRRPGPPRLRADDGRLPLGFTWFGAQKALTRSRRPAPPRPSTPTGPTSRPARSCSTPQHPAFRAVTAIRTKVATYWRAMSLPFPEPGVRLVRQEQLSRPSTTDEPTTGRTARRGRRAGPPLRRAASGRRRAARRPLQRRGLPADAARACSPWPGTSPTSSRRGTCWR